MSLVLTATEARNNFFDILNRVIYGGETVLVSKAGAKKMVKIERAIDSVAILKKLAGSISKTDAVTMEKSIARARNYPSRKIVSLD